MNQLFQVTARVFAVTALLCASAMAEDVRPNALTPDELAGGWKLLFDGHSTTAWRGYARDKFPDHGWVVEDSCLKNEGTGGGDLVTIKKFDDFDFKFDWKISPGGNSGVKYFVQEGKSGHSGIGCEYQLLDDTKNEDASNGPNRTTGALYALIAPDPGKHLEPVGQWNRSEIIVRGKHVEHWLNGAKVVEFEAGSPELKEAIAKSKFKKVPGFGEKMTTLLLLQDHGSVVWFQSLKIRRLNDSK